MVEYLYDAIRAVAGQDIKVEAYITDEFEEIITSDCTFVLHDKDGVTDILMVDGTYLPDSQVWEFVIPGPDTVGMGGRYWYCIQHENSNLCFKQPIYLK